MLRAFLRRDLLEAMTYKSQVVTRAFAVFGFLFTAWFMARTFAGHEPETLAAYGGYFPFLVFGVVITEVGWALVAGPADRLRQAQLAGTLELVAFGAARGVRLFALEGASALAGALLRAAMYMIAAAVFLDLPLRVTDPLAAALAVVLSLAALAPIGLTGAAVTLVLKRSDPVGRGLHAAAMLLSGVAYPTEVLPGWLAAVAEAIPTTHALRALRGAFLAGADTAALGDTFAALAGFAVVGGALALWIASRGDRLARRLGTLGHY